MRTALICLLVPFSLALFSQLSKLLALLSRNRRLFSKAEALVLIEQTAAVSWVVASVLYVFYSGQGFIKLFEVLVIGVLCGMLLELSARASGLYPVDAFGRPSNHKQAENPFVSPHGSTL